MADAFRCATASRERDEPLPGTAPVVRNWLLLEHQGPWGRDALTDTEHLGGVGGQLRLRADAAGVRVQLIRRPGTDAAESVTCFAIHSGPGEPWIERVDLARFESAVSIDIERLGQGERLGRGERHVGGLFLVCTNGRRDPCCAERGRSLAEAMASTFPAESWESSHHGGHRFAPNLLAFPHGFSFGRVDAADGPAVARRYLAGRLDLAHVRGRTCLPEAVQAAEHALREREGLDRIDDVTFEDGAPSDDGYAARFRTIAGRFEVRLAIERSAEDVVVSCTGDPEAVPVHRVLEIERR
jgi:hypothetical protein